MATDTPTEQPVTPGEDGPASKGRVTRGAIIGLAVAAIAIAGGFYASRSVGTAPLVADALTAQATNLAGTLEPGALKDADCAKTSTSDEYRCVLTSGEELRIVEREGSVSKRLAGTKIDRVPASADEVAELLATEQRTISGTATTYSCGGSIGFAPDGSPEPDITGYLCVVEGDESGKARFLFFTELGTVTRDYVLDLGQAGGGATLPGS